MAEIEVLSEELAALGDRLGSSSDMANAFAGELEHLREAGLYTGREMGSLSSRLSGGLKQAFDNVVFDGGRLSDALKGVAKSLSDTIYSVAMKPVTSAISGTLLQGVAGLAAGALPFANGGAFSQGRVMPFANGGIVSGPVSFPMRGGQGLMGEAGPEAIMPLSRGPDGRLGVQVAGGGRSVNVVMNINTADVQGFQRSQSQIAAGISRALGHGQRNR